MGSLFSLPPMGVFCPALDKSHYSFGHKFLDIFTHFTMMRVEVVTRATVAATVEAVTTAAPAARLIPITKPVRSAMALRASMYLEAARSTTV
jgi:hypothetical protein